MHDITSHISYQTELIMHTEIQLFEKSKMNNFQNIDTYINKHLDSNSRLGICGPLIYPFTYCTSDTMRHQ